MFVYVEDVDVVVNIVCSWSAARRDHVEVIIKMITARLFSVSFGLLNFPER